MKNVYFISDAHLGSWALDHRRMQERRLVRFLDDIKDKAQAVYMMGDMFDFGMNTNMWFPKVIPVSWANFPSLRTMELRYITLSATMTSGCMVIWSVSAV